MNVGHCVRFRPGRNRTISLFFTQQFLPHRTDLSSRSPGSTHSTDSQITRRVWLHNTVSHHTNNFWRHKKNIREVKQLLIYILWGNLLKELYAHLKQSDLVSFPRLPPLHLEGLNWTIKIIKAYKATLTVILSSGNCLLRNPGNKTIGKQAPSSISDFVKVV